MTSAPQFAAQFIPAGARVLELGCDRMALRRFLPNGCSYQGCDLIAREPDTLTCDFNAGEFPSEAAGQADVIVMLGVLEQIVDVESFFTHLRFAKRDLIISYCATDLTGKCDRTALGWVNNFSFFELVTLFDRYGFRIECTAPVDSVQLLMRLTLAERLAPLNACSVAVVSDGAGFGGRLSRHMIDALLPGEADVHHMSFATIGQARTHYDLVIVGSGDSLFQPLLGDDLVDLLARGKSSIGLFGTQYRELVPRAGIERLVARLDYWFARHQDDVLMYGRGRKDVAHLGDWLIDVFPLTSANDADQLRIGDELDGEPSDRAIAAIQRHKAVFSHPPAPAVVRAHLRRHGGLCRTALTARARHRFGHLPQHADRHIRPQLSGTRLLPGRSRRGRPLQGARPPQCRALRERIDATLRNVAVATRRNFIFPRARPI